MVEAFLAQGARVSVLDVAEMAEAPPTLFVERVDLRDIPAMQAAISRLSAKIGPPQVLIKQRRA